MIPFGLAGGAGYVIGSIAGIGAGRVPYSQAGNMMGAAVIGFIAGIACTAVLYYHRQWLEKWFLRGTEPETFKETFPLVREKLEEGWRLGKRPPTT